MRSLCTLFLVGCYTAVAPTPPPATARPPHRLAKLFGTKLALPEEVRELPLGATLDHARTIAPQLTPENLLAPVVVASKTPGVTITVNVESTKWIGTVMFAFEDDDVERSLHAAWGPGTPITVDGQPRTMWIDPAAGLRAIYVEYDDGAAVMFDAYRPFAKLVGTLGALGFEHAPILGSTRADVERLYAEWPGLDEDTTPEQLGLTFPPTELALSRTHVVVHFTRGIATSIEITFVPQIQTGREPSLEALWGAGIPRGDRIMYVDVASKRTAIVDASPGSYWTIQISRTP